MGIVRRIWIRDGGCDLFFMVQHLAGSVGAFSPFISYACINSFKVATSMPDRA